MCGVSIDTVYVKICNISTWLIFLSAIDWPRCQVMVVHTYLPNFHVDKSIFLVLHQRSYLSMNNCAWGVIIRLFQRILVATRFAVCAITSCRYSMRFSPTVILVRFLQSIFCYDVYICDLPINRNVFDSIWSRKNKGFVSGVFMALWPCAKLPNSMVIAFVQVSFVIGFVANSS